MGKHDSCPRDTRGQGGRQASAAGGWEHCGVLPPRQGVEAVGLGGKVVSSSWGPLPWHMPKPKEVSLSPPLSGAFRLHVESGLF